jgi:GrpB-like predicted nucleotidyltransferase (UPF0157 family)
MHAVAPPDPLAPAEGPPPLACDDEVIVRFVECERIRDAAETAFAEHAALIAGLLPDAEILHIGSTAIPGSLTKGDLDLHVSVPAEAFAAAQALLAQHFAWNTGNERTSTFASFKNDELLIPLGVQLTVRGSADDEAFRRMQARLREPAVIAAYNQLKRAHDGQPMRVYRAAKFAFLAALE